MLNKLIKFFLENKLVTGLFLLLVLLWGLSVMPFDTGETPLPRDPVPVDAIPDIGENQQIVFTEWPGRSPQDIEDQITYPLTVNLLGIPGVKNIRSYSAFGFSTIYIIFNEKVDFYWSRTRVLERLNTAERELPQGAVPTLGSDATALGQIFWYTLEGKGFSLEELRSIQDWYVRYALQSTEGISEVASIGGFVKEYQIDVDPDAMRAHKVGLAAILKAVKGANIDVGAKTIEVNRVEYIVRGIGFIKTVSDIENIVVKETDNVPIYIKNIAKVNLGPALRRGVLDKEGAEAVGGVAVVRYGDNPMAVIKRLKKKIQQLEPGLPTKTLSDGTVSKVRIVPFYDRTKLINETLGTLQEALSQEILITIIVILVFLMNLKSSLIVSSTLPLAVLMTFIMMKLFGVDANIMSLGGIAIAIGTIVDMGIVMTENIVKHLHEAKQEENLLHTIYKAAAEVGGAILTAVSTTIVSFLAVFTMSGPEGKLFKPLAFTKTFALFSSVIIALFILPTIAHLVFKNREVIGKKTLLILKMIIIALSVWTAWNYSVIVGAGIFCIGAYLVIMRSISGEWQERLRKYVNYAVILCVLIFLVRYWLPLGWSKGFLLNFLFVGGSVFALLGIFFLFIHFYDRILGFFLRYKVLFTIIPVIIIILGVVIWIGFADVFSPFTKVLESAGIEKTVIRNTWVYSGLQKTFPGMGKEFMPPLDEGSYLLMPTTMTHASIGEVYDVLQKQNIRIKQIPEVESVVGKLGRAETPLDPAPISMIETVINYIPEYGKDPETGKMVRQWREQIRTPDDIWKEILKAARIPGTTSAPKLQPIAARIVMLQSGMRAPMGIKVMGQKLEDIERFGLELEKLLKEVPVIVPEAVIADRIVGKPYLEFHIDREKIARYGVNIDDVQRVIEMGIGGMKLSMTVEGKERYPIRVRYQRELRDSIEDLQRVLVPTRSGAQIPLSQVTTLEYIRGPQVIKSEDTFYVGYVLFDKKDGVAEVDAVRAAQNYLESKITSGELIVPSGTTYKFAGSYENQVRSEKRLKIVLPLSLLIIFLILYFNFKAVSASILVFSGIVVAFAGGFILLWLYSQPWFMSIPFFGDFFRDLFNMRIYNLSVAVWVGFLALFGIASDNGVVMATYLDQRFSEQKPKSVKEIREATLFAAHRRLRPCLMTTATTILALLPILTSMGRGADVMIPMALPSVGGMMVALITMFIVPVYYCWLKELEYKSKKRTTEKTEGTNEK